jgi:DNA-directed RNA polymerase subunit RPC12/RpoP
MHQIIKGQWGFYPYDNANFGMQVNGKRLGFNEDVNTRDELNRPVQFTVKCLNCNKSFSETFEGLKSSREQSGVYCPHCYGTYDPSRLIKLMSPTPVRPLEETILKKRMNDHNYDLVAVSQNKGNGTDGLITVACKACGGKIIGHYNMIEQQEECPHCKILKEDPDMNGNPPAFGAYARILERCGFKNRVRFKYTKAQIETFKSLHAPAEHMCRHTAGHTVLVSPIDIINSLAERFDGFAFDDREIYVGCTCEKPASKNLINTLSKEEIISDAVVDVVDEDNPEEFADDLDVIYEDKLPETTEEEPMGEPVETSDPEPEVAETVETEEVTEDDDSRDETGGDTGIDADSSERVDAPIEEEGEDEARSILDIEDDDEDFDSDEESEDLSDLVDDLDSEEEENEDDESSDLDVPDSDDEVRDETETVDDELPVEELDELGGDNPSDIEPDAREQSVSDSDLVSDDDGSADDGWDWDECVDTVADPVDVVNEPESSEEGQVQDEPVDDDSFVDESTINETPPTEDKAAAEEEIIEDDDFDFPC